MKQLLHTLLITLLPFFVFSQTFEEKKEITKDYDLEKLEELAEIFKSEAELEKQKALELAQQNGWFVRQDIKGVLYELMGVTEEGNPLYYITNNLDAATSTRAYTLHNGSLLGLNVEGQNMTSHVWDGGLARSTHQEYDGIGGSNRFSIGDGTTTLHYHSAHVTGTIIASGFVAQAKGMAPQAEAVGYDWNTDASEATTAAASGMLLSNHSYGWGASTIPDWYFGAYNYRSREWDVVMYNADNYLMVCSAGNDGNDNTSNGDPLDGNSSYDKLSGFKTSKNNMVVANAQDANIDASGNLISVTINSGSSEGPTDDYRIKPDITGNGTGLYSSYESADNAYASISGTSMASPNVNGTLLLLQQHYNNVNSGFMRASTLKGLALHTADDIGPSGPDVVHGWGLLNAKAAANAITNNGNQSVISEETLNQGGSYSINVASDGVNDLVASISWTDPPGPENTGISNDNTPVLINDLDIRVTQGGTTYYPYMLTSITTNGIGDNIVDPYEKVIVSGAAGAYTITVNHKGSLSGGNQKYALIVTGTTVATLTAGFIADATEICTNGSVDFTDISIGSPTSWLWSFPGGTPSSAYTVGPHTITYSSADPVPYDVTLTVGDGSTTDSETKAEYITVSNVIADFTGAPTTIFAGNTVTFTDNSSCSPTSWSWSFPGGTPSSANTAGPHTITYNNLGTYDVTLTVGDGTYTDIEPKTNYINVINCSYCASTYTNISDDWITNVNFNTINNPSGQGGATSYEDFTSISTDVNLNQTYLLTVGIGVYNGTWQEQCWAWIDWNQNCQFDTAEAYDLGDRNTSGDLSVNITVPEDAVPGPTRMRIIEQWSTDPVPCDDHPTTYGETEDYTVNVLSGDIILDLKVYLEGPYNGTNMDALITSQLPLSQPFNISPWFYTGLESVGSIPANVVGWVLVQCRDAATAATATPGTHIVTQAAFLLNDGSVVDLDGSSNLQFSVSVTQNLYVGIWHPNHLGILSNNAVTPSGGFYTYDFTTGVNQVYGGTDGHKQIGTGVWGMYGGDGNHDWQVDANDNVDTWNLEAGESGYLFGDYNRDGEVDNKDKDDIWVPNQTKSSQVPN